MVDSNKDRVFISYASENLDTVRKIVNGLRKRKVNVWFDKDDWKFGKWKPEIKKAIAQSRYFLICISKAALLKTGSDKRKVGFQDEELNTAWEIAMSQSDEQFTIVPVRLEDCDRGDARISSYHQIDLFENFDNRLDDLAVRFGGVSLADSAVKDERTEDEIKIEAIIGKALTAYYSGDFEKFLTLTELALEFQPDNYSLWINKGAALGNLGKHEESLRAYERAIKINQNEPKSWYSKGLAYVYLKKESEAIRCFDSALKIDPLFVDAWADKGLVLWGMGQPNQGIKLCEKAIEIRPNFARGWGCKGTIQFGEGDYEEAIESFDKSLSLSKPFLDPPILFNKGQAMLKLDRKEEALNAFDIVLKMIPDFNECLFNYGAVLYKLGRHSDSIAAFKKLIAMKPNFPGIWSNLGTAYLRLERFEEAINAYHKAIEQDPNDHLAWNNKAAAHYNLNQIEEAKLCIEKALSIEPNLKSAETLRQKIEKIISARNSD